jgi:hypothetical protein
MRGEGILLKAMEGSLGGRTEKSQGEKRPEKSYSFEII